MTTIRKSATVKVMLSHNYNHFEASMAVENDDGVTFEDVDLARKDCARLVDKAIKQYEKAKMIESKRLSLSREKTALEIEVRDIKTRDESTWSVVEKAKVKTLADHEWNLRWDYDDEDDQNF